jgi:hypothetical protein
MVLMNIDMKPIQTTDVDEFGNFVFERLPSEAAYLGMIDLYDPELNIKLNNGVSQETRSFAVISIHRSPCGNPGNRD